MLRLALFFLIIAIVAGALGYTNVAAGATAMAKLLFFVFLALFVVCLVLALISSIF